MPHGLWFYMSEDKVTLYMKKAGHTVAVLVFDRLFTEVRRDDDTGYFTNIDPSHFKESDEQQKVRCEPRTNL